MKYIIMAGGEYRHWETPRQLLEIRGEPIIGRTIRLLREANVSEIYISTNDERFERFGVPLLKHNNDMVVSGGVVAAGCWVSAFYPTQEPACYVMGDVVFSPDAIRTIVNTETDGISFFASVPPFSEKYTKQYAEPFAFKVRDQERFRRAIEYVRENAHSGIFSRDPISWELWQVIIGKDPKHINYETIVPINDYTCDVDSPKDVAAIEVML